MQIKERRNLVSKECLKEHGFLTARNDGKTVICKESKLLLVDPRGALCCCLRPRLSRGRKPSCFLSFLIFFLWTGSRYYMQIFGLSPSICLGATGILFTIYCL